MWDVESSSVANRKPSGSTANLSATASLPRPSEARVEDVISTSDSEVSLPTTSKLKEISVNELRKISTKLYPNVPTVMNIPLMQKIRDVLGQEFLDALVVKFRFGNIDPEAWKVV